MRQRSDLSPVVERPFIRGDANVDGRVDISDGIHTLRYLFLGGPISRCQDAAAARDSRTIDIGDAIVTFNFLFLSGPPLAPPGPFRCGDDPTPDTLSCVEYPHCP